MLSSKQIGVEYTHLMELPSGETLLEKEIIYSKNRELHRGTVIGRMGATLLIRKKDDRKEKIGIEMVLGVVKKENEES